MKMSEWLEQRDAVCDQLIKDGWTYDDARFAVMTIPTQSSGLLRDQPRTTHPALEKLIRALDNVTIDDRDHATPAPLMSNQFEE